VIINMNVEVWIYSFLLYSSFRFFDAESTRLVLSKLDPELHEMNPMAPLFKKFGFKKIMIITWLVFASGIAFLDAYVLYPSVGFPILWLVFGIFHLMAAANNYQLYFQIKILGAEMIEASTKHLIIKLKKLSPFGKVAFLIQWNFLNIFFALYGFVVLVLTSFLLSTMNISFRGPIPYLLAFAPPIMIFVSHYVLSCDGFWHSYYNPQKT